MRVLVYIAILIAPVIACAHGLLIDAESDGNTISGRLYYTNGDLAVGESVAMLDLTTPVSEAVVQTTDHDARFAFPVTRSHRYRVTAYGDEGHTVEIELVAAARAKPTFVEKETTADEGVALPPAWALLGGLLLLSLVPATMWKRRSRSSM